MAIQHESTYQIELGGSWELDDLYQLPHAFEQVYALVYFVEREPTDGIPAGAARAFAIYPWRGGYSAVNFYQRLQARVPRKAKPRIVSIQYSSPGWLELALSVPAALLVSRLIKSFILRVSELSSLYHDVYKQLHERKLMKIEAREKQLDLDRKNLEFLQQMNGAIASLLGLQHPRNLADLAPNELARLRSRSRSTAAFERSLNSNRAGRLPSPIGRLAPRCRGRQPGVRLVDAAELIRH